MVCRGWVRRSTTWGSCESTSSGKKTLRRPGPSVVRDWVTCRRSTPWLTCAVRNCWSRLKESRSLGGLEHTLLRIAEGRRSCPGQPGTSSAAASLSLYDEKPGGIPRVGRRKHDLALAALSSRFRYDPSPPCEDGVEGVVPARP